MYSRAEGEELAPIHRIIHTFAGALRDLGHPAPPAEVERWSVIVDEAMAGRARLFHTHDHVFDLTQTTDAIEALAGLFHDIVYVQVDQGMSSRINNVVGAYAEPGPNVYVLKPLAEDDVPAQLVHELFGVQPGARLSPFSGLNELLSALVAARELAPRLPLFAIAEIVACIEGTIAFRGLDAQGRSPFQNMADRMRSANARFSLGLDEQEIHAAVRRALHVSFRDVQNFADPDPARFLDNTWKLLPETNPALRTPDVYSIREYRIALHKMEGFLSSLTPARVFPQYQGEPPPEEHQQLLEATARNLDFSVRYLRTKLYPVAILEALAIATGGDAPLELFTGGLPKPSGTSKRLEHYLPPAEDIAQDQDPTLRAVLAFGRASETSFDLRASPAASFLYRRFGEAAIPRWMDHSQRFFQGTMSAQDFLRSQSPAATVPITRATARLAVTRTEALESLAASFEAGAAA
ncbi:hypothetical protein [Hyalangium rubrum]|uniref:HD/PDEase domain-containing protein n=1 Tax=Hyalangium rubrum TaxID=3103134 RepID=A0ABU5HDZ7_9BACT|nr:hypothetical protein [Hyalangium sp. s54d21]MDY7231698.1 hypothetical protein [Hyalangium sp. s54d21]